MAERGCSRVVKLFEQTFRHRRTLSFQVDRAR